MYGEITRQKFLTNLDIENQYVYKVYKTVKAVGAFKKKYFPLQMDCTELNKWDTENCVTPASEYVHLLLEYKNAVNNPI